MEEDNMTEQDYEKICKVSNELAEIYTKDNEKLKQELADLLKETEEKTSKLRKEIDDNVKFIAAMKYMSDKKAETKKNE